MGISKTEALAKAMQAAREAGRAEARAELNRARPVAAASAKAASAFSLARVIASLASKDKSLAKDEWEMSRDVCREFYNAKSLTLANDTAAGFLVPPDVMRDALVPLLRSPLVLDTAGVSRMSGLTYAPVQMPRQSAAATGYWVGEAASVTESDQAVEMLSMNPHKAGAATRISNTLIRKTPAAAEEFVRRDLAEVMRRLVEAAFFEGSGVSGQPLGLKNISGINTVSFTSSTDVTKWAKLQQMVKEIEIDNANISNLVWVMHPTDYQILAAIQLPQAAGPLQGYPILSTGNVVDKQPRSLYGYPILTTTNITAGTLFLFDPADVVFADWGPMELRATSEGATLALADMTLVTAFQEVDVEAYHAVSVCTGTSFAAT